MLPAHSTLLRRNHVVSRYQACRAALHFEDHTDHARDH